MTIGHSNKVNHLILSKHIANWDGFFKVRDSPVNLFRDISTIQLDLHKVSSLTPLLHNFDLGVSKDTDATAVFLHFLEILLNHFLANFILPLLGSIGEGLLLRLVPVLVETPLALFRQMLCPDSLECTHATWGINVTHNTNTDHGRRFQDGHTLNYFLPVDL